MSRIALGDRPAFWAYPQNLVRVDVLMGRRGSCIPLVGVDPTRRRRKAPADGEFTEAKPVAPLLAVVSAREPVAPRARQQAARCRLTTSDFIRMLQTAAFSARKPIRRWVPCPGSSASGPSA